MSYQHEYYALLSNKSRIQRELKKLKESYAEELAEFNAGFAAFEAGVAYHEDPDGMKHDVWHCGWAWGYVSRGVRNMRFDPALSEQHRTRICEQKRTVEEEARSICQSSLRKPVARCRDCKSVYEHCTAWRHYVGDCTSPAPGEREMEAEHDIEQRRTT